MVERRPAGLRHSIKKQMAAVFSLLMMGTILLCWFINNFFLGEYYISKKQNAMFATYQILNMAATNGTLSTDSFDIEFQKNCGKYNINYILLDAESKTLKTSTPDYSTYSQRLLNMQNIRSFWKLERNMRSRLLRMTGQQLNFWKCGEFLTMEICSSSEVRWKASGKA